MRSAARDIAEWISDHDSELSLGGDAPWSLHVGGEPARPDDVVTLYDVPGLEVDTDQQRLWQPAVQIRTRSRAYEDAWGVQQDIRQLLLESVPFDHGNMRYVLAQNTTDIFSLGRDENERYILVSNYQLIREDVGITEMPPGLGLWLSAGQGVALVPDTDRVEEWGSVVGGHLFAQAAEMRQPKLVLDAVNGRPAVAADGSIMTGGSSVLPMLNGAPGATLFAVILRTLPPVSPADEIINFSRGTNNAPRFAAGRTGGAGAMSAVLRRLDADDGRQVLGGLHYTGEWIVQEVLSVPREQRGVLVVNGETVADAVSFTSSGDLDVTDSVQVNLLARIEGTNHLTGLLAELLVWPRVLAPEERRFVRRRLGDDYGIAITD